MKKPTTPTELRQLCRLSLCYDDERLAALLTAAAGGALPVLLSLPRDDARRVVAGCLPLDAVVGWARRCAERAQGYAASTSAYYAANYAAYASAYAYDASASASAYASASAAASAEHETALRDAVALLGW